MSRNAQREGTPTRARHGPERECLTLSATDRASARTAGARVRSPLSASGGPSAKVEARSAKAFK